MSDFFARLGTIYRAQGSDFPEYLRTHPVTTTRIAEAKARAEQVRTGSHRSSLEFALARERVRVLTARDLPRLVRYYREQRADDADEPRALRYGLALALTRSGGAAEAQPMLQALASADPGRLAYQLALAESERALRDFAAAEQRYLRLLAERPEHKVITLAYARAQIERDGRDAGRRAVEAMRPLMMRLADDPQAQELYARASELAGDEVRAAEAHARAFFLRGRVEDALRQLEETARRPDLDYYDRARIDAQVAQWRPVVLRERQRNGERSERRSGLPTTSAERQP
jgi:predicted Zn-dependent protease